jgi:hypothetical protein
MKSFSETTDCMYMDLQATPYPDAMQSLIKIHLFEGTLLFYTTSIYELIISE